MMAVLYCDRENYLCKIYRVSLAVNDIGDIGIL